MTARDPRTNSANGFGLTAAIADHDRWLRTAVFARLADQQFGAWLYRVAIRQALLYRRKRSRERSRIRTYAERTGAGTGTAANDPLRWILDDEQARLVQRALQRLVARDRELLLLKYSEGWSCSQLAERLGVSVTAVETRLHRARQRLRHELERREVQGDER